MSSGIGIKMTTATTGTGAITLAAVSGSPTFANFFSDGEKVPYAILNPAGEVREWGLGTLSSSGTVLTRTWIGGTFASSVIVTDSTAAAVSLAGTETVIQTDFPGSYSPNMRGHHAVASGQRMVTPWSSGVGYTGSAAVANRLYLIPFKHESLKRLKALALWSGTPSGNGAVGLYRLGNDGYPAELIINSGSMSIAASASFNKYTLSNGIYLPPDWYALAAVIDNATASFRGCTATGPGHTIGPWGVSANGFGVFAMYLANGSITLPNPCTASATAVTNDVAGFVPTVYVEYEN